MLDQLNSQNKQHFAAKPSWEQPSKNIGNITNQWFTNLNLSSEPPPPIRKTNNIFFKSIHRTDEEKKSTRFDVGCKVSNETQVNTFYDSFRASEPLHLTPDSLLAIGIVSYLTGKGNCVVNLPTEDLQKQTYINNCRPDLPPTAFNHLGIYPFLRDLKLLVNWINKTAHIPSLFLT